MTAIGFVLIAISLYVARIETEDAPDWFNNIFVTVFCIGLTLIIAGIAVTLWRYFP